jgi:hypothetical protein
MSTLTVSHDTSAAVAAERAIAAPRRPIWRRVLDAIVTAQQRRAEREIARFIATHGGVLTDDAEREIMSRLAGRRSV